MLSRTKENEHAISSWPEGYFPELCTCYHQLCKKDQGWYKQCVPSMHILISQHACMVHISPSLVQSPATTAIVHLH